MRFRRTAVVCLVAAAASCFVVTGPAKAFPTPVPTLPAWKLVRATSVSDGRAKSVTVTCPDGYQVVGTGGQIIDTGYGAGEAPISAGRVSVVDMYPNVGLTSVTVTGGIRDQANWDPAVDTFEVQAVARCARTVATPLAQPVVTGLSRVVAPATTNGTTATSKSAVASCPLGASLYGTGFQLGGANGKVFVDDLIPDPALTSVTVGAYDDYINVNGFEPVGTVQPTPWAGTWSLWGYAICGDPSGHDVLTSTEMVHDGFVDKTVDAPPCPSGSWQTGAAVDINQDFSGSFVALKALLLGGYSFWDDPLAPAGTYNRTHVHGSAELTDPWWAVAYTICH